MHVSGIGVSEPKAYCLGSMCASNLRGGSGASRSSVTGPFTVDDSMC